MANLGDTNIYGDLVVTGDLRLTNIVTVTSAYTSLYNDIILANTSGGAFTVTCMSTPVAGDRFVIIDIANSFETYNLTVDRNGSNIMSTADNVLGDVNSCVIEFIYTNSTYGWKLNIGGVRT